jgi:hypothetical protein
VPGDVDLALEWLEQAYDAGSRACTVGVTLALRVERVPPRPANLL